MKITNKQLKQIIKEELEAVMGEETELDADPFSDRTLATNMPEEEWNGEWTLRNLTDANGNIYIVFPQTPELQKAWEEYNDSSLSGESFLTVFSQYYGRGEKLFGTQDEYQEAAVNDVVDATYGE